ncbi:MAG: hypothetical protein PHE48_00180 [Candidatus Daviesbacteria bacterium]|nr:hypothetical protein [Candidatus Daviesbacteria bacterium]
MIKKHSQGFINPISLVLIAFLVIGVGIFFFLKNKGITNAPPSPTESPAPTQSQTENSQIPDDWLTFKNTTYLYQINYPPQFHAQGDKEPPYPPPPVSKSFTLKYDNGEWCDFAIVASTNIEGFRGEIASIREQGKDTESLTTIAGVAAFVFDAQGGDAINRTYYLDQNNPRLRMGYNYRPAGKYSQECADIVTKMVSSFKFL